jgi:DNA-binding PadR family transcriptional regulator
MPLRVSNAFCYQLNRAPPAHRYTDRARLRAARAAPGADGRANGHGNLYRFLRLLEAEQIVRSEWEDDLPGPSKRTYELRDDGRALLAAWAVAIGDARERIDGFLTRYGEGR